MRPGALDSDRQRPRAVQVASFAAKTASPTCSAAENVTLPKEQTRFRSMRFRSQKRTGDTTDTCAASSSGRNRTVRADLSSKPPWTPLCNRQLSNYIIIVCNYSISSNDRSPPNPAVDKQALILPSTNRRFAIEFQAVRSCCSSAMPL